MIMRLWITIGGSALIVALAGCSATDKRSETPPPPVAAAAVSEPPGGGTLAEGMVQAEAIVEDVDVKNRRVTLRGSDGDVVDLEVGPEVKNLPQIRKGDTVTATYYESIGIKLANPKDASPGITTAEDLRTADPGEKPAAVKAKTTKVTATVVSVDKKNSTAVVRGPRGREVTVNVKDPAKLDRVKAGDLVEIAYTEAVAIEVSSPAKKTAKSGKKTKKVSH
jgi:hypothetical protein